MSGRRLVIVGSFAESFVDFRGNLAKSFISHGYEVIVFLPQCDVALADSIKALGVNLRHYNIERAGKNPLTDLATIRSLKKLFKETAPSHVIAYTIKPVIYSNLALMFGRHRVRSFALITGLGFLFTAKNLKTRFARMLILPVYRQAIKYCEKVLFQNPDDRRLFIANQLVSETKSRTIAGSGVDMSYYTVTPLPEKPVFLMVARLVRDKGINEYFAAARLMRQISPDMQFHLVGYLDDNPTSLSDEELRVGLEESGVTFHGRTDDIRPFITLSSVFVLPSYREGTPRSVLEAMSMGRAIITTDVPGCRETVVDGVNGLLVKPQSVEDLLRALQRLVSAPSLISRMGAASRQMVSTTFNDEIVNSTIVRTLH